MQADPSEFFKLDTVDRKVLFWIMEHSPRVIPSWIEYIVQDYRSTKRITIDARRLEVEINDTLGANKNVLSGD